MEIHVDILKATTWKVTTWKTINNHMYNIYNTPINLRQIKSPKFGETNTWWNMLELT